MKCVIIANGDFGHTDKIVQTIKNAQIIISADGGAQHLRELNILPHVMIGDFDSIDPGDFQFFKEKKVTILTYSLKKDHTDTDLCVSYALEHHASDITFLGVTGTRLDHTLANIFLLKRLALLHIPARIINQNNEIYIVTDCLQLKGTKGELLSIVPATEIVTGITLTGLEYPLNNADIQMGDTIGISNVFKESIITVNVKKGMLIVTRSQDAVMNNLNPKQKENV